MRHKKQNRNKKKNRISPQKEEGDTALFLLVGVLRFERRTPCSQSRCANRTALHPDKNP